MEELRQELMKVVKRISENKNATSAEIEALAKVASVLVTLLSYPM